MQLYDRGVRRRLAPMLGNDIRRMALLYSLMFTLPGTPVLRYGEEIGMGDDLSLPERNAIRTPMQWSSERNGGFSRAPRNKLVRPVISDGDFGWEKVNVQAQQRDPNSLLNLVIRMIRTRKEHPELGLGDWNIVDTGVASVLAIRAIWDGLATIAIHNLSEKACKITLNVPEAKSLELVDDLYGKEFAVSSNGGCTIELDGYGFYWFTLSAAGGKVTPQFKRDRAA
jgi:maltose alpha-D-glucosyltransferase/alpha-amylase